MWTTIFVLAIAVNFEPTRIALIALMLSGPRPVRQLFTFLGCIFVLSVAVGLLVLFVFDREVLSQNHFSTAKIQIGIGVILTCVAAVVASNIPLKRPARNPAINVANDTADHGIANSSETEKSGIRQRIRGVIHGNNSWLSGASGLVMGMPSVEYLAVLALIVASNSSPAIQLVALFAFLLTANAVSAIPLVSYFFAPTQTQIAMQRFNVWIRARSRRQVAAFLAAAGVALVMIGVAHL